MPRKVVLTIDTCRHFTYDKSRRVIVCSLHEDKKIIERGDVCTISYIPIWCPLEDYIEEPLLPAHESEEVSVLKAKLALVTYDRDQLLTE